MTNFQSRTARFPRIGVCHLMLAAGWFLGGGPWMSIVTAVEVDSDELLDRFSDHCFECHGYGEAEGGFSFESLGDGEYGEHSIEKWEAVWKNIRSETMPPSTHADRPDPELRQQWLDWINRDVFNLSADRVDPGRIVLRRLNRNEYQQTILDLTDVRMDMSERLPPDDTGFGFDTIGETLTLSPVLLERYIDVAEEIIDEVIPSGGPTAPKTKLQGWKWRLATPLGDYVGDNRSITKPHILWHDVDAPIEGDYQFNLQWSLQNGWIRTPQSARLDVYQVASDQIDESGSASDIAAMVDGRKPIDTHEVQYHNHKPMQRSYPLHLSRGKHWIGLRITPQVTDNRPIGDSDDDPVDYEFLPHESSFEGPIDAGLDQYEQRTERLLFNGPPPEGADAMALARHAAPVIQRFAAKAYRRPVDRRTLVGLTKTAIRFASLPGNRYEDGVAMAMKMMLVSPRFLYRGESPTDDATPLRIDAETASVEIDSYSLASRLSYFLWGSMPDIELMELAQAGKLNDQLDEQIDRMIKDKYRLENGVKNFVGQWLKIRDVDQMNPEGKAILRTRNQKLINDTFNWRVKSAMQQETYEFFKQMIMEDRPLHELLNADYTYLNGPLAKFYGIDDVSGKEMRRVDLPDDSHRGGVLTHGSVLLVTSNPTRTSPVKRGLFILENLLGAPGPPAPPDVPELTDSAEGNLKDASLRDILAAHRDNVACASCHSRMDPLGLALENYNAWGQYTDVTYPPREKWWRAKDDQPLPVDSSGTLMTGESFESVAELADILANERRDDFYRCVTEKWMTFALGRGLTYRDTTAVDQIIEELHRTGGSTRSLIRSIVHSVPFTRMRIDPTHQQAL